MADQCPTKNDIQTIFNRLRSIPTNKTCFDCNSKNPTWASVTYGIFICIDCSAVHRSLGVHLTFVRSTQLDTNWTWLQIRQMQLGGNANALSFFLQHNYTTSDAQQKYNSRAAQLYRDKLQQLAIQAMKLYGTKLELDSQDKVIPPKVASPSVLFIEASPPETSSTKEEIKDIDFFEEQSGNDNDSSLPPLPPTPNNNVQPKEDLVSNPAALLSSRGEPNVNLTPITLPAERKSTICGRKPQAKKPGLGSKKGGLGAQKVKTNFAEIEREAAMADQLRVQAVEEAKILAEKNAEEEQKQIASMRLAYHDLSIQQKKEEEKLRQVDPKKAQQVERLGMGFGSRSGVSHSALNDMQTIEQETPAHTGNGSSANRSSFDREDSFFEDFHFVSGLSSMYKNSNNSEPKGLESLLSSSSSDRKPSWNTSSISSSFETNEEHRPSPPPVKKEPSPTTTSSSGSGEAQRKFGSAKAISSEQYFGDSTDTAWERKNNLARFEGSSSISSAEFFGTNSGNSGKSYGSQIQTPDLEEMRESVRQGVIKAAVKLGSLANGVMSSIQDRYGY